MRPDLLKLAARLAEREERFAIVTVVRREPPSSARVGDVALVSERGEYHGWTGGGCTRSSVLLEAMRAIADGEPRLLSLSPEPEGGRRPGVVFLPMTCESGGTVEIYVEPVLPAARLLLFGSSPAVRVLARIAHAVGYRVDVIDPEADESAFPEAKVQRSLAADALPRGAHVLVATMGDGDIEAIEAALARSPAYLGVIASPKRFAQLRDALLARGVARSHRAHRRARGAGPGRAHARGDRREHHRADRRAPASRGKNGASGKRTGARGGRSGVPHERQGRGRAPHRGGAWRHLLFLLRGLPHEISRRLRALPRRGRRGARLVNAARRRNRHRYKDMLISGEGLLRLVA